ncbi:MAG: hypothetical protein ACFFCV_12045 [Promethearchaeota archaeon]
MPNIENNYIRIPKDIEFLLEMCQDLLKTLKTYSPNEDIPIDRKQLAKLNEIAKKIR